VSHGDFINYVVQACLMGSEGAVPKAEGFVCTANCSFSAVEFEPGGAIKVLYVNDTHHLTNAALETNTL
jgi:broad specificity phosphatase PhoE